MNITIIGISTGGPRVLRDFFEGMPCLDTSMILIQHMPRFINEPFCRALESECLMNVRLAGQGDPLETGVIHVAPSEFHLMLENNRTIHLVMGPKVNNVCPSVDVAMLSLRARKEDSLVGVVMTGLGCDGAEGIRHVKQLGGVTLAQDERTSPIFAMPQASIQTGCVDWVGSPGMLRRTLIETIGCLETANPSGSLTKK